MSTAGVWQTDDDALENTLCAYYDTLFSTSHPSQASIDEVLSSLSSVVTADMNVELTRQCTKDKVWIVLSQMHPCKASGPDGMHVIFYQKF